MKDEQLFGICLSFESTMAIEEPPFFVWMSRIRSEELQLDTGNEKW